MVLQQAVRVRDELITVAFSSMLIEMDTEHLKKGSTPSEEPFQQPPVEGGWHLCWLRLVQVWSYQSTDSKQDRLNISIQALLSSQSCHSTSRAGSGFTVAGRVKTFSCVTYFKENGLGMPNVRSKVNMNPDVFKSWITVSDWTISWKFRRAMELKITTKQEPARELWYS